MEDRPSRLPDAVDPLRRVRAGQNQYLCRLHRWDERGHCTGRRVCTIVPSSFCLLEPDFRRTVLAIQSLCWYSSLVSRQSCPGAAAELTMARLCSFRDSIQYDDSPGWYQNLDDIPHRRLGFFGARHGIRSSLGVAYGTQSASGYL
jgi:hypothetical protein